jgi:prophage regulatory protein
MLDISKKERFLRLADVIERTGLSRSYIYLSISKDEFPTNIKLSSRSVAWLESEIDAWMQTRIHKRSLTTNPQWRKQK